MIVVLGQFSGPDAVNLRHVVSLAQFVTNQQLQHRGFNPLAYVMDFKWEVIEVAEGEYAGVKGEITFPDEFEVRDQYPEGMDRNITDIVKSTIEEHIRILCTITPLVADVKVL